MALIQPLLDKKVLNYHMTLEQPDDKIQALYIWIDGTGQGLRCKTKTIIGVPETVEGMFLFIGSSQSCLTMAVVVIFVQQLPW